MDICSNLFTNICMDTPVDTSPQSIGADLFNGMNSPMHGLHCSSNSGMVRRGMGDPRLPPQKKARTELNRTLLKVRILRIFLLPVPTKAVFGIRRVCLFARLRSKATEFVWWPGYLKTGIFLSFRKRMRTKAR